MKKKEPKSFNRVEAIDLKECLCAQSRVINTRLGPVEYAEKGEGPVILSIHGGPGGYDQALGLGEIFRKAGFKIIAPSRPGYLRTPAVPGQTCKEQAAILNALLEALEVNKAIVLAASAGGPMAYQLAMQHPEKIIALIPIDSVCMKYTKLQEISMTQQMLYLSKPGIWVVDFLMKYFPAAMVNNFLKTESSLNTDERKIRTHEIVNDDNKLAFVEFMIATITKRYNERKAGLANDISILKHIDHLPLNKIICPTLIIHGKADSDVTPTQAEYAQSTIKHSKILWIEKASHIGFWIANDAYHIQKKAVQWLQQTIS